MKKAIWFWISLLAGLFFVSSKVVPLQGAIPPEERAALIALYNATNGDSWEGNSGWKDGILEPDGFGPVGSEGTWYGITVGGEHVTELALDFNNLNGSIPSQLEDLTHLSYLSFWWNNLAGSIPPQLGNLVNLQILYLGYNNLSGSIPPELGNLSNLNYITLEENRLSGSIPAELGNLSKLEYLYLSSNQLSGSIPAELGNLNNLVGLVLSENELSGSIPAELGNLSNLVGLRLSSNQLSGSIPAELGNLSNLDSLCLSSNQLSGSIPAELGNLSKLENKLYLHENQLSGSIPAELGNLINLEDLYLSSNQLSGSIPAELGNLRNLYYLDLSSNQLSGSIPTSLTNLTNLWWIGIRYNCLYTNDPGVRALLSIFDPDWESYQCLNDKKPPIGSFDTPIDGSTVCSSIPVTGWALDDTGINSVKIYRKQGNSLIYFGDAVFVEGARPDVAQIYPEYPDNTRAGWGYMMLTNFLPNSGNGTFVLHAIATDFAGKTTTLGTKTIHCDNDNAVKPFGAIDTPAQGGTASGSSFVNWGWVLTPPPNGIPTDGSTIHVFVDGVDFGHPIYNIYRSDIATLFPGYANSEGAIGYFYLDTTAYTNGVHTICWTAADSGGNVDGIGSRYFTIQNSQGEGSMAHGVGLLSPGAISNVSNIPIDYSIPVRVKKGFNWNVEPFEIYPDDHGIITIKIVELERIEVQLFPEETVGPGPMYTGHQVTANQLTPLPIGSTLDAKKGIFCWMPGPGFIGEYQLAFIVKGPCGDMIRRNMIVTIIPKFTIER